MSIVARYNATLGIRVHEYAGAVQLGELVALSDFYGANPSLVQSDVISIVDEAATGHHHLADHLMALRERFRQLHAMSSFVVVRRSAWICPNLSAWPLLEQFLQDRHSRDGQGSELCLVANLSDARCLFEADELDAVQSAKGFQELFNTALSEGRPGP